MGLASELPPVSFSVVQRAASASKKRGDLDTLIEPQPAG